MIQCYSTTIEHSQYLNRAEISKMNKTEVELINFFVFNSTLGSKEGQEQKKILYYYPITDNVDKQIKNMGLVEAIIQFTSTFKPQTPVNSLHTQKTRQLYFQAEPNFWLTMTLGLPKQLKEKDNCQQVEYLKDDVQDNVYGAVLEQAYYVYRIFRGSFTSTLEKSNVGTLKTKLENFYKDYLKSIKLAHCDLLNVFSGIQYLPLDKLTFMKVQSFVNSLECTYPCIEQTAFLYTDYLIWCGIEPGDMKVIYQYLVNTLLPVNVETELQGGSIPRSPFALHYGRFIVGPANLKTATSIGKIYLFNTDTPAEYNFVVYRAFSATICLFIKNDFGLDLQFFKDLDDFINPRLRSVVTEIADYCTKQVVTPSNIPETSPRFIYFNKLNLAYKSTVHLDNKQAGNIAIPKESLQIMADFNEKKDVLGVSSESIVKTMNAYWVIAKNSNLRQFYVALQQKSANLDEISGEVKKLCERELKGIFFHPV